MGYNDFAKKIIQTKEIRATAHNDTVLKQFRKLKGFRRVFTRFDKLDSIFRGFIVFVLIVVAIK